MENISGPDTLGALHSQSGSPVQAVKASENEVGEAWESGAASHGFKQEYRNALVSESRTCLEVTEAFVLPEDGSEAVPDCGDAAFQSHHPPRAPASCLEAGVLEACQERFVMFDHTGDHEQTMLYPAMTHDCSSLLQFSSNSRKEYLRLLQVKSVTSTEQWKEISVNLIGGNMTAGESGLLCIKEDESEFLSSRIDLQLDSGVSRGLRYERPFSLCLGGDVPVSLLNPLTGAEAVGKDVCNDVNSGLQMLSQEDTDDIEALLSSDNELSSTGHSPSDVLTNNFPILTNDHGRDGSLNSGKKRKRKLINQYSDDDAESSTATSAYMELECPEDRCLDTFCSVPKIMEPVTFKHFRDTGSTKELTPFPDEMGSRNGFAMHRAMYNKPSFEKQGPAKRARQKKIRQTFQLLRNIIPGGGSMDTAFVLDEAIQYVKSLQVKAQRLEARKFI